MVRQRPRNSLEEVYGSKFEASKSQQPSVMNNKNLKDHGYIITSNTPYSSTTAAASSSMAQQTTVMNTSRRKSARSSMRPQTGNMYKNSIKEEKDDERKEYSNKIKTSRGNGEKWNSSTTCPAHDNKCRRDGQSHGDGYGTQNHGHGKSSMQNHNHINHNSHNNHNNHNHHQNHQHDEDKEDDTEEFFELIRQTVEGAIGKSISELLNRNFRELSAKIDRFSMDLKNTNELLSKIQIDLNNKIIHYGEENSRHFRYLCMKSEYDKMFYQHQTMLAAKTVSSDTSHGIEKKMSLTKSNSTPRPKKSKEDIEEPPCTCRSSANHAATTSKSKIAAHKSESEENNISQKSSEVGMREVLDHIQRFCTQMQMNEKKNERPSGSKIMSSNHSIKGAKDGLGVVRLMDKYIHDNGINIDTELFRPIADDDDDDLVMSSDGMTPRSEDDLKIQSYGGLTMRSTSRGGVCGGGDA